MIIKTRLITEFEKRDTKNLFGLVIGVGRGSDIEALHSCLDIRHLWLIDPYLPFKENGVLISNYVSQYDNALPLLKKYSKTTTLVKKWACNAVDNIPDDLDFVWLDFSGDYDVFLDGCHKYYPKVKSGGIFSGKRYTHNWEEIKKALHVFCDEKNLVLHTETEVAVNNVYNLFNGNWWVIKK